MSTVIDCPACRRKLRVPEEFLGKGVRCPDCEETFVAPASAAVPPSPEAAPAPLLNVPLRLELDDQPVAARPAAAPPERRRERERHEDDEDDRDRRRRRRRDFAPCPRCGDDIRRGAVVCPYCGLDLEEQGDGITRRRRVRLDAEPHRAGLVQGLGIASLVLGAFYVLFLIGLPLGIAAWVMGRNDLKQMADGVMDPDGHKKTKDGWLCGLIGTCLNAFWGLCLLGFISLRMLESASSKPPPPVVPARPAGQPGGAPQNPPAGGFSLSWPAGARPVSVKQGDEVGKMVLVDVERARGYAGRITVMIRQPLPAGLRVNQPEVVKEGGVERVQFTLWADDARPGEGVLRLVGRGDDGREVVLDLPVKVVP